MARPPKTPAKTAPFETSGSVVPAWTAIAVAVEVVDVFVTTFTTGTSMDATVTAVYVVVTVFAMFLLTALVTVVTSATIKLFSMSAIEGTGWPLLAVVALCGMRMRYETRTELAKRLGAW